MDKVEYLKFLHEMYNDTGNGDYLRRIEAVCDEAEQDIGVYGGWQDKHRRGGVSAHE